MNKGFDWDGFKKGDFAVYCDTEDKVKAFLEKCDIQGIRWQSGEVATNIVLDGDVAMRYKEDGLRHASRKFYEREGDLVIDYDPEMFKEDNLDTYRGV